MRFRMLGPLEAEYNDQLLPLGGVKQRATLSLLLLQPNRVVAASQLVRALWPIDAAPTSARKMLHNAVWGLRKILCTNECAADPVTLVSQTPGYLLRVDPDQIDLYRFHRLTKEGRAALAAGSVEPGAALLREALSLWRGPALADLVEAGISWPELAAVQSTRQDTVEDYLDAELASGNHLAVLGELETMAQTHALRERSCGQLMLAMYRCGRQADALSAYRRWRSAVVEKLGLEPGPELQRLHHRILTHDPALLLPSPAAAGQTRVELARDEPPEPQNMQVSVLIIRTVHGTGRERVDKVRQWAAASILDAVAEHGGTVVASIGSTSLALFGAPGGDSDDAERAVRAAMAIQDALGIGGLKFCAAVATGEALVHYQPGGVVPMAVSGALLDHCEALLSLVPAGQIQVCDQTRLASGPAFRYLAVGDNGGRWQVESDRTTGDGALIERQWDLQLLVGLLERTRHRAMPHLVTLLGEPGAGKTRFMQEFASRICGQPEPARLLTGTVPARDEEDHLTVHREMLRSYCGIGPHGSPALAREKLATTVHALVPSRQRAQWLMYALDPLVARDKSPVDLPQVLAAWGQFLRDIALRRPLVVALDQLHLADEATLDFVQDLTDLAGSAPLLVVAVARPSLLRRRPGWGGGKLSKGGFAAKCSW